MPVEWVDDTEAFAARDWAALVRVDPEGTFFHTPRFLKLYWEEFGTEGLRIAVVTEGDEDVAVAPFHVRDGVVAFLGGFDVTDYMGPVGIPAVRDRAAKEIMSALALRDEWQTADLRGLPVDGRWLAALEEGALDAGLAPERAEEGVAPMLRLPSDFDGYLRALRGKHRHEIRRKSRRFREAFPDARIVDATPATANEDVGRFVELHRASRGAKGRFMVPGMELFFRRLAEEFLPDGTFRMASLDAEGRRLASAIGFRDGDRFRLFNSAYDHDLAAVSPGMVLVAELIRDSIRRGDTAFDFLKGDLAYKYRFGAVARPVARLLLRR